MARYIKYLESADDGTKFSPDEVQTMHNRRPLLVRYDLEAIVSKLSKDDLLSRPQEMWRYRELLPVGDEIQPVSMVEQTSPLVDCPVLAGQLGLKSLVVKDESRGPSNSFKCRGLSMATTMARHFGARVVAMASNGNAGGALGLYAARAGLDSVVFMPMETMASNLAECLFSGTRIFRANGLIDECGAAIRKGHDDGLWFDISTMKEPYRLEGKKTMGLELAEQFQWNLPDVILYPTGGGTALIAMWKAFEELAEMGWLTSSNRPRMIACQSDGCQPIVDAYKKGSDTSERVVDANTKANGLRVPHSIGDFLVLEAIRKSHGKAVGASEDRLEDWQRRIATSDGLFICPESATCIGVLEQMIADQEIGSDERVVVFNTAAGQKYVESNSVKVPEIDLNAIDWSSF
ncbi:threonine synthase [bacterium]|nr:threonine synthase [bacterium]